MKEFNVNNTDIRCISIAGCVLLVVIRLSIGWQLLYEGLWKFSTQQTAKPWTAEPYLKNSQGPFRDYYRGLTGDPDDLRDLDYDTIEARWTGWAERFKKNYGLDEGQSKTLDLLLKGPKEFARKLEQLPPGVEIKNTLAKAIKFDPKRKMLIVDGKRHLTPREKRDLLRLVNFDEAKDSLNDIKDPVIKAYVDTVQKIYLMQSRLSYLEQAKATLQGDPKLAGKINEKEKGTIDEKRLGQIEFYKDRLKRFEANQRNAKTAFDREHLDYDWKEIQKLRSELVGPIRKLEADLKWKAEKLLTTDQLAKGPMPPERTAIRDIDLKTMWTLTIVGILLLAGLFTRVAALAGAFLLMQFYLSYPPFPGYPQPPGPEHSLIVNKNFIEMMMLLTLVFLPTGRWFGLDALFPNWLAGKKTLDDRT